MKPKTKRRLSNLFTLHLPLWLFLIFTLFPFYWVLISSFKREIDILKKPLRYWPNPFTLENYQSIMQSQGFGSYFLNSAFTAGLTVLGVILITTLGGYALSRYRFRGKGLMYALLLITQMLPGVVLVIPLFEIFNNLRLVNTLSSLTLIFMTTQLPFCMIMMSGFIAGIPRTMEEAAQIDGCSLPGAIFRVVIPTLAPGMVATGAFAFVGAWNNFIYPLILITDKDKYPISLGLSMMKGEFQVDYGSLCAGCIVALLPVLLLFAYIQKYLVAGLASGAVKG